MTAQREFQVTRNARPTDHLSISRCPSHPENERRELSLRETPGRGSKKKFALLLDDLAGTIILIIVPTKEAA